MVHQSTENSAANGSADESDAPSRIKLQDGRYLAYRERGVPKSEANYKIIFVHGFGSSKEMKFLTPKGLMEELGIYFLLYDRAGYGGSDPNPKRTVKSEALDIKELADQLDIGPKFYLIGVSMGSYPTWGCLKYIPERIAGAALVVPVINYRWPSFPKNLLREDKNRNHVLLYCWIAKHTAGLLYWWVTNKWSPSTALMEKKSMFFNERDIEALAVTRGFPMLTKEKLRQPAVFDTLRDDFIACFGDWEFDPLELSNPFPQNPGLVHIWQGHEDKLVPFKLQRFVTKKLAWIHYHEVPDGGHLLVHYDGMCENILRALLLGERNPSYIPNTD